MTIALRPLRKAITLFLGITVPVAILFASHWFLLSCVTAAFSWLVLSRQGRLAWSIACLNIASIPRRPGSAFVVVVGIAGVVAVFVALLAMGAGFEATLRQTGTSSAAIVLQSGARAEAGSVIDHQSRALISQAPKVRRNAEHQPIYSPEVVVTSSLAKKRSKSDANIAIRGVGQRVWELRPKVAVIQGRKFTPGLRELVAGKGAHDKFAGIEIGSTLNLNGQPWSVVGIFDSHDAYNSELWGDTVAVASAFHRESGVNSVTVQLTAASDLEAFKATLANDPRLKVEVQTTQQFFSQQSEKFSTIVRIVGVTIGAIMALGAAFGALNTMYASVIARSREIGTLRAIGFKGTSVIVPVLLETLLLAVSGGLLGAGIAWVAFDGLTASTVGDSGQVIFAFKVTPLLLMEGIKWALAIGLIGGLFPALRAASMPLVAALREL